MKELKKNEKNGRKEQREKENMRKIKAEREREEEDSSRKTACTLPNTELSDFKLQTSLLSGLIIAKVK